MGAKSNQLWTAGLKNGCVHLWEFNGNGIDRISGKNVSIPSRSEFVTGLMKNAIYLRDENNDAGGCENNTKISLQNCSINSWVQYHDYVNVNQHYRGYIIQSGVMSYFDAFYLNNDLRIGFQKNPSGQEKYNLYSTNYMPSYGWVMATMTVSARSVKLYINSALGASGNMPSWGSGILLDATSGRFAINIGSWLIGMLEQVAIWNRVLSDSEISLLYNFGKGLYYD